MTVKILLRIASVLMLTHLIGHSFGQNGWKKTKDPILKEVGKHMMGPKFPNMGVFRSMGDYFDGYGYAASVSMCLFVIVLWLASCAITPANSFLNNVVLVIGIAFLVMSIIEFIYFFPLAAVTTLLACILVFISWYMLINNKAF